MAAHMRPGDQKEIYCQLPGEANTIDVAAVSMLGTKFAYTARYRGRSAAAFGFSPISRCGAVYSAWMWGTELLPKCIPRITRYSWAVIAPQLVAEGVRRVEVRSVADHTDAHRWLINAGARCECELLDYGKNGETFKLFSWTESSVRKSYVPKPKTAKAAA